MSQFYQLQNDQISLILANFQKCFAFDKEQMIDTAKFEQLAHSLPMLFRCTEQPSLNYEKFIEENVGYCIIELFYLINDDYKWKTLNYNIMQNLKSDQVQVKVATLRFLQRLIDRLKDRFAVLV